MCDYSLHNVKSRPAVIGDKLVVESFPGTFTRGLASPSDPDTAVCLRPGTEVALEERNGKSKVAKFIQMNMRDRHLHHDALQFTTGETVYLTKLYIGQKLTVLQLPAAPFAAKAQARKAIAAMITERLVERVLR